MLMHFHLKSLSILAVEEDPVFIKDEQNIEGRRLLKILLSGENVSIENR